MYYIGALCVKQYHLEIYHDKKEGQSAFTISTNIPFF